MRFASIFPSATLGLVIVSTLVAAELPTAEQVGARAEQADLTGTNALRNYVVTRHYVIDNPRFNRHAEMTVKVSYKPGSGKTFEVLSQKNAEGMQKKVFDKLIEAEKESSRQEIVDDMRIGPRNYTFQFLGTEMRAGRKCYKLALKPKRKNKFLIEGTAWVSADDYGVVHLEGRPAERVSFWVGKPQITQTFCKVGPVWMMAGNRSVADVKIVGKSELLIESFDYKVQYLGERDQIALAVSPGSRRMRLTE